MANDKRLLEILKRIENGTQSPEGAMSMIKEEMIGLSDELVETIGWISNCPYILDENTIPKGGIEVAPKQVVGNLSLAYVYWQKLININKKIIK